ncbi:LURP-one-related/scramblase family protein [Brachybacterium sp. AOP43-C2-M15]|uniref:LURP-one-related/scramblase family protein n=1 Tax=Brachybacterium sp. AOP43-C2-M15 TaxID=3457661 RepID=UPI0040340C4F
MDTSAQQPATPELLRHDTLVMQQITGFMSNDFDILDGTGERAVGHVTTTGDGLTRFFAGARSLDVADADGTPLLHVEDPPDVGMDRFELTTPGGALVANVTNRIAFFSTRVGLTLADGMELELHGDMFGFDFTFQVEGVVAARVTREWAGLSRGFLGHSRYVLSIDPTVPPHLRQAIIGGCIVLDLIRAKRSRRSS